MLAEPVRDVKRDPAHDHVGVAAVVLAGQRERLVVVGGSLIGLDRLDHREGTGGHVLAGGGRGRGVGHFVLPALGYDYSLWHVARIVNVRRQSKQSA